MLSGLWDLVEPVSKISDCGLRIADFVYRSVGLRMEDLLVLIRKTVFMGVILRSPAKSGTTKNLIVTGSAEILRGVYPEYTDGLRMTWRSFRMESS